MTQHDLVLCVQIITVKYLLKRTYQRIHSHLEYHAF
jgi:hypothetical protein